MRKSISLLLLLPPLLLAGCSNNPLSCVGPSCICVSENTCDFTQDSCGGPASCDLFCNSSNVCNGSCGALCSIACTNNSTCTVTVGAGAAVTCQNSSVCHVTCTGGCSVSCQSSSTCDLTCPSDTSPTSIPNGGQCT